jgi:peroxiredoxin Q/BCP
MKIRPLLLMSLFSVLFGFAKAEPLNVGDAAPVISGVTDSGATLNLGDVYKKNNYTVVWFYPKALTGGCTKQGCSLRDASADLKKLGREAEGI